MTQHPAHLAALEIHRCRGAFGSGAHAICQGKRRDGHPCTAVAVKGSRYCQMHGGGPILGARPGREAKTRDRRAIVKMERAGVLPAELLTHPAYVAARRKGNAGASLARALAEAHLAGDATAWADAVGRTWDALGRGAS